MKLSRPYSSIRRVVFALGLLATATALHAVEWEQVWSDEFNYEGLPDKSKWGYEHGYVRNHESQYYTSARLDNARVENGMLVIECKKDQFKRDDGKVAQYTAASLITQNKASWQYGRVEVRAKIPQGKGVWPAIWMLGTNISQIGWPACGEIDIMESVGKEPNNIYGTLHFAVDRKHKSNGGKLAADKPADDFHIYAIEWFSDRINFYYDKQKYHTVTLDEAGKGENNPFRKPHYLLINFALGGDWGGSFSDDILPQKYLIDYVRVYKQKDEKK